MGGFIFMKPPGLIDRSENCKTPFQVFLRLMERSRLERQDVKKCFEDQPIANPTSAYDAVQQQNTENCFQLWESQTEQHAYQRKKTILL